MQMISNYEIIKTNLSKNDPKGFEEITLQFKTCNDIEMQKKILVLLLKNVKKTALLKYKVLGEFNSLLMKINIKQIKDGIYELLYEMHSKVKDNTKSFKESIQVGTWNHLKFENKEVKTQKGYAFIDSKNVAFYSTIENFVINYESIESFSLKENTVTFNLKNDRKFIFTLFGDCDLFIKRLKLEFKIIETFKNIAEVYRSPNTSIIIKKETVPNDVINQPLPAKISIRRSSLSETQLVFNSDNTKSFGNNLKIKITPPKKKIFSENSIDETTISKKILITEEECENEQEDKNKIEPMDNNAFHESYQSTSESNNLIQNQNIGTSHDLKISKTTFDTKNPLEDKNDNQNKKKLVKNEAFTEISTFKKKKPSNKLKNKNYQIKITKKIGKFVKSLTKKRIKNLNSLHKIQGKNIKQRGEALKNVLLTFIKKYMKIIKLN